MGRDATPSSPGLVELLHADAQRVIVRISAWAGLGAAVGFGGTWLLPGSTAEIAEDRARQRLADEHCCSRAHSFIASSNPGFGFRAHLLRPVAAPAPVPASLTPLLAAAPASIVLARTAAHPLRPVTAFTSASSTGSSGS